MQNNVTELTQRLLRALDSGYNVVDMQSVIEIVSLLEKVAITKELLETTRLGRHVNELRRNTTNESLAKRAKELVKKWRNMVLPDSNGQLQERKRPPSRPPETVPSAPTPPPPKRPRANGQSAELDLSDNSNSSFKDAAEKRTAAAGTTTVVPDVIVVNSDSNSSVTGEQQRPPSTSPKKRGRKKGSRCHRNLLDEAETSFTNKMAVSRGNAKVKTTKELVASLQSRTSLRPEQGTPGGGTTGGGATAAKPMEDLNERAAKLTERVSIIDQKLNTNANRYKNVQRNRRPASDRGVLESGSIVNAPKREGGEADDGEDVVVVFDDPDPDDRRPSPSSVAPPVAVAETKAVTVVAASLEVEEALAKLPPIDPSALEEDVEEELACTCQIREKKSDDDPFPVYEIEEDEACPARVHLERRYHLGDAVTPDRVAALHAEFIANVNGNPSLGEAGPGPAMCENDDAPFVDVVPKVNVECLPKDPRPCENYKKYSISEERTLGDGKTFREWHEVVETTSYDGEILKILPYCIID